ncbi:MAG: hypothetical protein NT007_10525 [Candidatus Kapabacteria bacterium]|nr:hypothetical protein [Candidatus Kapabacteria bacterium]
MKIFDKYVIRIMQLLIICGLLVVSCQDNPSTTKIDNSLSGTLVDEQGNIVPLALIDIYNSAQPGSAAIASTSSDEDGNFSVTKLPSDATNLNAKVTHPDFKPFSEKLILLKSKSTEPVKLMHLDTCHGILSILTTKCSDSTLLSNVEIRMFRNGTLIRKALTQNGTLLLTNVCPGTYILRFYKPNFKLVYDSITSNGNDTLHLQACLQQIYPDSCCHGKITVTVKDTANNNIDSAFAYLLQNGNAIAYTHSDHNGLLMFGDLCPGDYSVKIGKSGYNYQVLNLHLGCSDSSFNSSVILSKVQATDTCCKGSIRIALIDKKTGKAPTTNITLKLLLNGAVIQTMTTMNYTYFSHLCPGKYQIHILSDYYDTDIFDYTSVCNAFDTTTRFINPNGKLDTCCQGKIDVIYQDSTTKTILPGTCVYLFLNGTAIQTATADKYGAVHFTGVCKGDYDIKGVLSNYNYKYFKVSMKCNDSNASTQYMSKITTDTCCNGKIDLYYKDSVSSKALQSVAVYVYKNGTKIAAQSTDANGVVHFTGLCSGTYTISGSLTGYTGKYLNLTMGCNESYTGHQLMVPKPVDTCCHGKIDLIIKDSASLNPLKGVYLYLIQNGTTLQTTSSDVNGAAHFTGVCKGDFTIKGTLSGYNYLYYNLTMKCNDSNGSVKLMVKTVPPDSCCTAVLNVTVVDSADGSKLAGATVYIMRSGFPTITGTTDADGKFSQTGLCSPVTYTVKALRSDYNYFYQSVTYNHCNTQDITLKLKKK